MRILLVEDEERLADALAHILKKHGYETDVAYNGEDGLDYALSGIYDAIILDRMLPVMNGIDIIKRIRKEGLGTPVIFLTAIDGVSERVDGLDAGADDYLVKPFSTEELLARIRALLRRKEKELRGEAGYTVGNIEYMPELLTAVCGGKKIKLTFKEGQLFELFMMNKGNTLSKDRILDKVWGFNTESDITIVEIYIHHLRKKILVENSGINIETIRGVGYRLTED